MWSEAPHLVAFSGQPLWCAGQMHHGPRDRKGYMMHVSVCVPERYREREREEVVTLTPIWITPSSVWSAFGLVYEQVWVSPQLQWYQACREHPSPHWAPWGRADLGDRGLLVCLDLRWAHYDPGRPVLLAVRKSATQDQWLSRPWQMENEYKLCTVQ